MNIHEIDYNIDDSVIEGNIYVLAKTLKMK